MARGGARPGAGRRAGGRNAKQAAGLVQASKEGISPVEYMFSVMRDEDEKPMVRLDAAKSAAPYVHPRLAAVEHSGKVVLPVVISSVDADL